MTVDLRGFRWPLRPLERKLELQRDAVHMALAKLQAVQEAMHDRVLASERVHAEQLALLDLRSSHGVDPLIRSHALRSLVHHSEVLGKAQEELARVQADVEQVRTSLAHAQTQLVAVRKHRASAERVHAAVLMRTLLKEADHSALVAEVTGNGRVSRGSA